MKNCRLLNTTLAFEYSSVDAEIVSGIESVMNPTSGTIRAEHIGELIMEQLKQVDEVAYVRFASVYRQFTDVNTFIKEIEKLIGKQE